jgi:serine/threonine-protein kinase HipA
MSQNRSEQLNVFLKDRSVGVITRLPDDRTIFTFDSNYVADALRPVLSLSFKATDGSLVHQTRPNNIRLGPFFSNLLPEGHLRTYLTEKLGIKSQREFFLLAALGDDLPGAVRIKHDGMLNDNLNSEGTESKNSEDLNAFRFSLAGIQMKFSAIQESNGRITIPAKGMGGDWIVKLPAGKFENVPDAEFAMMTLARNAGIGVPEFKLVPTGSIENLPKEFRDAFSESFAVQRFDRQAGGGRVHMEDFAQVFGIYGAHKYKSKSYANIAEVLWFEAGEDSVREFVRRLVFNIAIGNGDMHLKNWSLLYEDETKPRLSPAYDLIPTIAFMDNQALGLSLGGEKHFEKITDENFKRMAATAHVPEKLVMAALNESKEAVYKAWTNHKANLALSASIAERISSHFDGLPLFAQKKLVPVNAATLPRHSKRTTRIISSVEFDPQVPAGRLEIESRSGFKAMIEAPMNMRQWVLAEKIFQEARSISMDSPVTVLANEELYREWRSERYVTIPKAAVFSGQLHGRSEHIGHLRGEFSASVWSKLSQAYKDDQSVDFDLPMENGSIRSFQARVLKISEVERRNSGETAAVLRLAIKESHLILSPLEDRARIVFNEDAETVSKSAYTAINKLDWINELSGVDHAAIHGSKKIQVAYNSQLIDAPFSVRINVDYNGRKTIATIVVSSENPALVGVSKEQTQIIAKAIAEHVKMAGRNMRQILMPISSSVASPNAVVQVRHSELETTDAKVMNDILDALAAHSVVELVFPLDSIWNTKPIVMKAVVLSATAQGNTLRAEFEVLGPIESNF